CRGSLPRAAESDRRIALRRRELGGPQRSSEDSPVGAAPPPDARAAARPAAARLRADIRRCSGVWRRLIVGVRLLDHRRLQEILLWRGRAGLPLQSARIPGIVARPLAVTQRP